MPAGVHGTGPGMPSARRPMFTGWSPSTSLAGSSARRAASKSICGGVGCWMSTASTSSASFISCTAANTSACEASSPRWMCGDVKPSDSAFSIFMRMYPALAESPPTRMVPRPGVWPAATRASMRGPRSANTASATGAPGMSRAVISA